MVLLYLSAALLVIGYGLYLYVNRNFKYWKKNNVIGPEPVSLFGNLKETALRRKAVGTVFKEMYDEFPNEKVIGIYRMTTPCLLIRDLDIIKHIMIKDFDAFVDRGIEFSKKGLGINLFHADGETWRVLRNRFTPIFTSGKLRNMMYLMTEQGDKFVDYISKICLKQREQEVHSLVQKYTISTISACAFGLDTDIFNEEVELFTRMDKLIFTSNYANELDMMYPGILKKINMSIFPIAVRNFFNDLVKTVFTQRNGKPTNRKDFMDLILEMKQCGEIKGTKRSTDEKQSILELTDEIIAAQAFVFYAAGYETSATTMAFMLYTLAQHPDIQNKVIEEIDEVLKIHNGQITYDTLKDMTYLDKVFNETLRMYPIVDPLQRNAQIDYKVPGTNVTIKKGQTVLIPVLGIHHDEKYYPNPEIFDPERFSSEKMNSRHPCAYIPFGIGPRNCIGMRFAQTQSRVCIVKMLSRFRVEPSPNTKLTMEYNPYRVILSPDNGIRLNIVPRN
uniref:unspecific monooxygenase n=1 Tax=Streltzoviella insularis TaxID=1206366 RepID=A0A7D5YY47_9NEOP|nr:cytochrome P450 20 [Streltzoviella insularis]